MARTVLPRLLVAAVAAAAVAMGVAATELPPQSPPPFLLVSLADLTRTRPELASVAALAAFADARGARLFDIFADEAAALTLFAPTNGAMLGLARTFGYTGSDDAEGLAATVAALTRLGEGDPVSPIRTLLTYAVLPGAALNTTDLVSAGPLESLQGARLQVLSDGSVVDQSPAVADGQIVRANVGASNGFMHIVDRVLLPLPVCPVVVQRACAASGGLLDEDACVCVRRGRRGRRCGRGYGFRRGYNCVRRRWRDDPDA